MKSKCSKLSCKKKKIKKKKGKIITAEKLRSLLKGSTMTMKKKLKMKMKEAKNTEKYNDFFFKRTCFRWMTAFFKSKTKTFIEESRSHTTK